MLMGSVSSVSKDGVTTFEVRMYVIVYTNNRVCMCVA